MFLIILAIIVIALIYFMIEKKKKTSKIIFSIETKTYIDGVEQPSTPIVYEKKIPKLKLYFANESYDKNKLIKSFIRSWSKTKEYSPESFKEDASEDQILKVFDTLEKEYILYYHIKENTDDIVLTKFRELYPEITKTSLEQERFECLDLFLEEWTDVWLDDYEFKKKPTKTICIKVFEQLEKQLSYQEITESRELVLNKFRELYPEITNTVLEMEALEELEYFLEDWSTWEGALEYYKPELIKKPTKKQMKDIFYALFNDGMKPKDICLCNDDIVFNKLMSLYPELMKV